MVFIYLCAPPMPPTRTPTRADLGLAGPKPRSSLSLLRQTRKPKLPVNPTAGEQKAFQVAELSRQISKHYTRKNDEKHRDRRLVKQCPECQQNKLYVVTDVGKKAMSTFPGDGGFDSIGVQTISVHLYLPVVLGTANDPIVW